MLGVPDFIKCIIVSCAISIAWMNCTLADSAPDAWTYAYKCDEKTYIIRSTETGWELWNKPAITVGTTYDGFSFIDNESGENSYLRRNQNDESVLDIINVDSVESHACHEIFRSLESDTKGSLNNFFGRFEQVDFYGEDIENSDIKPVSLDQCEAICDANVQCVAYSYAKDLKWCFPKSDISNVRGQSRIISGIHVTGCERNVTNMAQVRSCLGERGAIALKSKVQELAMVLYDLGFDKYSDLFLQQNVTFENDISTYCNVVLEIGDGDLRNHSRRWDTGINCLGNLRNKKVDELVDLLDAAKFGDISKWDAWK